MLPILADTYGSNHARCWWVYWGVFFMARADRRSRNGEEWFVSHYLFGRP
jgi:cyclopropane-fatty-acyl-phospholipid synthase